MGAGILGWVLATVAGAVPDGSSREERLLHDICQTLGAASLAAGAGGGLVLRWRRAEWRRRTQWVLADLLDRAQREVLTIAVRAVVLTGGEVARFRKDLVLNAFRPPWTAQAAALVTRVREELRLETLAMMEDAAPDVHGDAGLSTARPTLEPHLGRFWEAVVELSGYVEEGEAPALLTTASRLHEEGRKLVDPVFGHEVGNAWGMLARLSASCLLDRAVETGTVLSTVLLDLERRATDPTLRSRLQNEREATAEYVGQSLEALVAQDEVARATADASAVRASFRDAELEFIEMLGTLVETHPGDHRLQDAIADWKRVITQSDGESPDAE